MLSNQGHTAREIAAKLDCNERTALKWIGRFNRHGVAGLEETLREGCSRVYGPEDVGAVIQAALTQPQELGLPFASWTLDRLVAYLSEEKGMGRTRISEVLVAEGLRWRKQEGITRGREGGLAGRAKWELGLDRDRKFGGYVFGAFVPATSEALTATYTSRSSFFETWERIEEAISRAVEYWNAYRHPYVWGWRRRHRTSRRPGIGAMPTIPAVSG